MDELAKKQTELALRITGVLLDTDVGPDDASLEAFCETVYYTSEICRDDIVKELITARM